MVKRRPRADRAATLYCFHPLSRYILPRKAKRRVPILMYHSISDTPKFGHPYYETVTAPVIFEQQISFLAQQGYRGITLRDAAKYLRFGPDAGDCKYVVLTFDDGYRDFYENALPILVRYNFVATMFIASSFIAEDRRTFSGIECMTWTEVRHLRDAGIEIGSHTVTHPQLLAIPRTAVDVEIGASKILLEDKTGASISSFSYPYAFPQRDAPFMNVIRGILEKHGYNAGVSTILGTATEQDEIMFLKRLPINSYDDLELLNAKLEGGYDWVRNLQTLFKVFSGKRKDSLARE